MKQHRSAALTIAFGISCLLHAGAAGVFYLIPHPETTSPAVRDTSLLVQFEEALPTTEVDHPSAPPPPPSSAAAAIPAMPENEPAQIPPSPPTPQPVTQPEPVNVVQGPAVPEASSTVVVSKPEGPASEQSVTHGTTDFVIETSRPDYLRNPRPKYPHVARERRWQGTVLLRVEVLADGTAGHIEIATSSGFPVLDEAALQAVHSWKFLPARVGETSVRSQVEVPIVFRLENE